MTCFDFATSQVIKTLQITQSVLRFYTFFPGGGVQVLEHIRRALGLPQPLHAALQTHGKNFVACYFTQSFIEFIELPL